MLTKLLQRLQKFFAGPTPQDELDNFIIQHSPTSVGDVEHWIKVYDRKQYRDRSTTLFNL